MMKDFIIKHKALSWILGIVGTLILGGLGSGVWEVVLKPIFSFLGNAIINFLVQKSSSFSDEIYQSISLRSLDRFQAQTYSLIVTILGSVAIFASFLLFSLGKKKLDEERDGIENNEKEINSPFKNHKNFYIFMIFYFLLCCILFVNYTYDGIKTNFIARKVINFEYLLKVNNDVLSEIKVKDVESQFAQIKNVDDYEKIIKKLEKIAKENNKHINKNPL